MKNVKELRNDPMVNAWIDTYRKNHKSMPGYKDHEDCFLCGFPHDKHLLCGSGATFGELYIGGNCYYVDTSNVESFLQFRKQKNLNNSFHWRDDIHIGKTESGDVIISFFTKFNNTPQKKTWNIPYLEWKSIVDFIEQKVN